MTKEQREQLKKEMDSLPKGGITYKTINNTPYAYYQWQENGKQKSRTVKGDELEELSAKLARKKAIRAVLNGSAPLESLGIPSILKDKVQREYLCNVIVGSDLKHLIANAEGKRPRFALKELENYLYCEPNGKMFVLYGLKQSGKTTLMHQALANMKPADRKKAVYVQIQGNQKIEDLQKDLWKLHTKGVKYVFADEITNASDFIEGSSVFSEVFIPLGMKIVLSGANSLEFVFAGRKQLYDKCMFCHITPLLYKEFCEIFGKVPFTSYLKYGGHLKYADERDAFLQKGRADEHIDSCVTQNISASLAACHNEVAYGSLWDLQNTKKLEKAINWYIKHVNQEDAFEIFKDAFKLENISGLKDLISDGFSDEITPDAEEQIRSFLDLTDLTAEISEDKAEARRLTAQKQVFLIPTLRYAQSIDLLKNFIYDLVFADETAEEKRKILNISTEKLLEAMVRDQVLLETSIAFLGPDRKNPKRNVEIQRLKLENSTVDMLIFWPEKRVCQIYSISADGAAQKELASPINDAANFAEIERLYGRITGRGVLYLGPSCEFNGIAYLNIEDYLTK